MQTNSRQYIKESIKHIVICLFLILTLFPLYVMVIVSFKDNKQFIENPWLPEPISNWHWENWLTAWDRIRPYLENSIAVSYLASTICIALALTASYVFSRYKKIPINKLMYHAITVLLFLPGTAATTITLFVLLIKLGLINTLWALVLVGIASGQAFCIFILKHFIDQIPTELFEAAEIDGASAIRQILYIVIPSCGPIITTLFILQFVANWNNFILPFIVLRDDFLLTLPAGLARLEAEYIKDWGSLMASYAISSIPMIILFAATLKLSRRSIISEFIK